MFSIFYFEKKQRLKREQLLKFGCYKYNDLNLYLKICYLLWILEQ